MDYPYLNTNLQAIKGERWKDIPGLEGYFLVSNFGRVKRCAYEMQYRNGAIYKKPQKIIKPYIIKQPNKFIGDTTRHLCVKLRVSGQSYQFTITRLVYYCFVQRFDLTDRTIQVVVGQGDNLLIDPSRLRSFTRSQKQQRVMVRKRFRSPFHDLPEETRRTNRQKAIVKRQKQVSQYSISGKKIRTHKGLIEAERATGVLSVSIRDVANGHNIRAGRFVWRWGNAAAIDMEAFLAARRQHRREKHGLKVTQYTLSGAQIARYPSLQDAQEATGTSARDIRLVIRGKRKSTHGHFWKKGYGTQNLDLRGYKWGRQSTAAKQSKRVAQYSITGKHIQTYDSVKSAAAMSKVGSSSLSAACRGLQHTCRGYKWKFV